MALQKCSTPGCGSVWIGGLSLGTGKCPMCLYKQKKAQLQFEAFKQAASVPLAPTAELTPMTAYMLEYDAEFAPPPRDEALKAIGRAFDDAVDLAYLG